MELSRNAVISHSALRLSSPDDLNASESANFSNAANETPASSISLMVANIFFSRRYKYFYVFFPYSFYLPEAKSQCTILGDLSMKLPDTLHCMIFCKHPTNIHICYKLTIVLYFLIKSYVFCLY